MIRCIAIDDEPLALQQIAAYIGKIPDLQLVAQCQSAIEARQFLEQDTVDIIFCDINMPDLNGMDFVKSLTMPPHIVFTTAYADYAVEGFKVNAVDYLLKPFGLQEFQRAVQRLRERMSLQTHPQPLPERERSGYSQGEISAEKLSTPLPHREGQGGGSFPHREGQGGGSFPHREGQGGESIFLKTDYRIVKVTISDIRYVEAMSEYLKVHLEGETKPIVTLLSMKKMEERLPSNFMRIHRSYIINLDKIREVNKNRVIMDADTFLPVGDNYKEAFQTWLDTRFLGK